jgi:hypothetical protein
MTDSSSAARNVRPTSSSSLSDSRGDVKGYSARHSSARVRPSGDDVLRIINAVDVAEPSPRTKVVKVHYKRDEAGLRANSGIRRGT